MKNEKTYWALDYTFDTVRLVNKEGLVIHKVNKELVIIERLKALGWSEEA